jgi:hypothetical protein
MRRSPHLAAGPLLTIGGKPAIVFVSKESCPFCAAERWPLAVALAHFGTWSQLGSPRHRPPTFTRHGHTLVPHGAIQQRRANACGRPSWRTTPGGPCRPRPRWTPSSSIATTCPGTSTASTEPGRAGSRRIRQSDHHGHRGGPARPGGPQLALAAGGSTAVPRGPGPSDARALGCWPVMNQPALAGIRDSSARPLRSPWADTSRTTGSLKPLQYRVHGRVSRSGDRSSYPHTGLAGGLFITTCWADAAGGRPAAEPDRRYHGVLRGAGGPSGRARSARRLGSRRSASARTAGVRAGCPGSGRARRRRPCTPSARRLGLNPITAPAGS